MELENAVDFLGNKRILITGASGFLGKVLVEKILRVQPNVEKLYLLIRAKDNKPILKRLHDEMLGKDLFRVLREKHGAKFDSFISEKLTPIAGDTSLPDLGMDTTDICKEIDAIIHVAATTGFSERYDLALRINTLGARNVMNFAKKCFKLQILVHVSTAYVCGEPTGVVLENPTKMGETLNGSFGLDIDAEKKLIDNTLMDLKNKGASTKEIRTTMKQLGQQRAKLYGWPNTYVFSKAMGEMLVEKLKEDLPVVIIRPTMICSTYKEPFPGWIEGSGSAAAVSIVYGKGYVDFMHADGNSVFDLIPADMVVNSMVVAMAANAKRPSLTVYHVGSSLRNPITYKQLVDINYSFFNKNPWIDDRGMSVKIQKGIPLSNKIVFFVFLALHFLKLMALKLLEKSSCHTFEFDNDRLEMQLKATVKVSEIFRPYVFFAGIFDDSNTEKLRIRVAMSKNGKDKEHFSFDPKTINWEDYLFKIHIPATVKYLF